MNNKNVIIGIVVLVVLLVGAYFLFGQTVVDNAQIPENENQNNGSQTTEEGVLIVNDQLPGNVIFFQNLTLENDGFVVVRDQDETIIGSLAVDAGEDLNGNVELLEPTVEGGIYSVQIYIDTEVNEDEERSFDPENDELIYSTLIETTEDLPELKG